MPQNYPKRIDDKRINQATKKKMVAWKQKIEKKMEEANGRQD